MTPPPPTLAQVRAWNRTTEGQQWQQACSDLVRADGGKSGGKTQRVRAGKGALGDLMSGSYQKPRCTCCGKLGHEKPICWYKNEKCKYCLLTGHTPGTCRDEDAIEHYKEYHADKTAPKGTLQTAPKGGGKGKKGEKGDGKNGKSGKKGGASKGKTKDDEQEDWEPQDVEENGGQAEEDDAPPFVAWVCPDYECRCEQVSWSMHCYKCGTRRLKESIVRAKKETEEKKEAKNPAAGLRKKTEKICSHYLGPIGQEQESDDEEDQGDEDETEEMDKPSAARYALLKRQLEEMEAEEEGVVTKEEIEAMREKWQKFQGCAVQRN